VADANEGYPNIALVQAGRLEKILKISFATPETNVFLRRVRSDGMIRDHNTGVEVQ
jgi:hypothetical protein